MTIRNKSIAFAAVLLVLATGSSAEVKSDSASNALNLFGLKFLAETSNRIPEDTNLAISPYTVWMAMSIVNEGARGLTAAQLERALLIPTNASDRQPFRKLQQQLARNIEQNYDGVTLNVLNSLFTRSDAILNRDYVNLVRDVYNVLVESLDFDNAQAAAQRINKLISDATKGRIPEVVNSGNVKNSYMFIISALFFKGRWDKKFDVKDTKPEPFYNERKEQIGTVDMMRTNGAFPFGQILNGKAIAVELPYVGGKFSMILALPVNDTPLSYVLHAISETPMSTIVDFLKKSKEMFVDSLVNVRLPKFKIATSLDLGDVLQALGVRDVFDSRADLTGISSAPLLVSYVLHKTEIEVDEDGTVGSSATVVDVMDKTTPPAFIANKPFAFFVIDKESQTAVFAGRVCDPNAV